MATAHGVVILDNKAESYSITARVVPDRESRLYLKGRVAETFPIAFSRMLSSIRLLNDHMDLNMDLCDIHLRINTPHNYPLAGESFALACGMAILASARKRIIPAENCYTGIVNDNGRCISVADIQLKRRGAAGLGFKKLFLPRSQIDLFSTVIAQCPCGSLADAYGITFWDE